MCKVANLEMEERNCKREHCRNMFRINKDHHQKYYSNLCESRSTGQFYFVPPLESTVKKDGIFNHKGLIDMGEY